jgi:hypothetical protein
MPQEFKGIVYVGIGFGKVGRYLESQIDPGLMSSVTLSDKSGKILYSPERSVIGKNVLSSDFQNEYLASIISDKEKDTFNELMRRSLAGEGESTDISISGKTNTISYTTP